MKRLIGGAVRVGIPIALIVAIVLPAPGLGVRIGAAVLLVAYWLWMYRRYRASGLLLTRNEYERLRTVDWDAYWRHYNERVPTVEQEFEEWGPYHQHRHEMRYDIVAGAVRKHLPVAGRIVDIGCGSANVADRLRDIDCEYIGLEFAAPLMRYATEKYANFPGPLRARFARADAAKLPFADGVVDVVVMSEVIEHLIRPELAVWEISRILKPGGVFVMTTNNASEVPLRTPLSHPLAWIEKAWGADHPDAISWRPWVWPEKVEEFLVAPGLGDVYLPHTHHISGETRRMFADAGMNTITWGSFEFPPPQSETARILEKMGAAGRRIVDVIEAVCQHTPLVRRLGTHLYIVARKDGPPVAPEPPPGTWPGPLSGPFPEGKGELSRLERARR